MPRRCNSVIPQIDGCGGIMAAVQLCSCGGLELLCFLLRLTDDVGYGVRSICTFFVSATEPASVADLFYYRGLMSRVTSQISPRSICLAAELICRLPSVLCRTKFPTAHGLPRAEPWSMFQTKRIRSHIVQPGSLHEPCCHRPPASPPARQPDCAAGAPRTRGRTGVRDAGNTSQHELWRAPCAPVLTQGTWDCVEPRLP